MSRAAHLGWSFLGQSSSRAAPMLTCVFWVGLHGKLQRCGRILEWWMLLVLISNPTGPHIGVFLVPQSSPFSFPWVARPLTITPYPFPLPLTCEYFLPSYLLSSSIIPLPHSILPSISVCFSRYSPLYSAYIPQDKDTVFCMILLA